MTTEATSKSHMSRHSLQVLVAAMEVVCYTVTTQFGVRDDENDFWLNVCVDLSDSISSSTNSITHDIEEAFKHKHRIVVGHFISEPEASDYFIWLQKFGSENYIKKLKVPNTNLIGIEILTKDVGFHTDIRGLPWAVYPLTRQERRLASHYSVGAFNSSTNRNPTTLTTTTECVCDTIGVT